MEKKPFIFGVATSGDNFTDREKETSRLVLNFRHGVNTVLISPRRWGKTSLVQKACRLAQSDKLKVVYIDIFSCRSDRDFYDAFASAILKQTSSKLDEWLEHAKLFLSRISPKISLGTDPMTDFSISLEMNPKSNEIDEILQLPEKIAQKKGCNIVVCIDEFQQIAEFKDSKTFQKRLRSIWQLQKSVSYCLFGSKKHLMNELFEKRSLPFYKFGDAIYLTKIGTADWVDYILDFETGKTVFTMDVSNKFGYNNMAIGMYAGNSGNALYCPTGYLELLRLQDRFVYLPEMPYREVNLDKAARNVLTQEQFEQAGGEGTVASWRNTVTVENVHPNTTVSFRMNNLSGSAADLKLYAYGADGKLAEVSKELWTITDESGTGVDTLTDGTLYELRVSVADDGALDLSEAEKEIIISVVLSK